DPLEVQIFFRDLSLCDLERKYEMQIESCAFEVASAAIAREGRIAGKVAIALSGAALARAFGARARLADRMTEPLAAVHGPERAIDFALFHQNRRKAQTGKITLQLIDRARPIEIGIARSKIVFVPA